MGLSVRGFTLLVCVCVSTVDARRPSKSLISPMLWIGEEDIASWQYPPPPRSNNNHHNPAGYATWKTHNARHSPTNFSPPQWNSPIGRRPPRNPMVSPYPWNDSPRGHALPRKTQAAGTVSLLTDDNHGSIFFPKEPSSRPGTPSPYPKFRSHGVSSLSGAWPRPRPGPGPGPGAELSNRFGDSSSDSLSAWGSSMVFDTGYDVPSPRTRANDKRKKIIDDGDDVQGMVHSNSRGGRPSTTFRQGSAANRYDVQDDARTFLDVRNLATDIPANDDDDDDDDERHVRKRREAASTQVLSPAYFNGILDASMALLRSRIRGSGKASFPIPSFQRSFNRWHVRGDFTASQGWLLGFDAVQRHGDVTVLRTRHTFLIQCHLVFPSMAFGYKQVRARLLGLGPSGSVTGSVGTTAMVVRANVTVLNATHCDMRVHDVTVSRLDDITIAVTGLGQPLNWLASRISSWLARYWRTHIAHRLSRYLQLHTDRAVASQRCDAGVVSLLRMGRD